MCLGKWLFWQTEFFYRLAHDKLFLKQLKDGLANTVESSLNCCPYMELGSWQDFLFFTICAPFPLAHPPHEMQSHKYTEQQ